MSFLFNKKKCLFLFIYDKCSENKNLNTIKNRKGVNHLLHVLEDIYSP
jgi:hypothetical protein